MRDKLLFLNLKNNILFNCIQMGKKRTLKWTHKILAGETNLIAMFASSCALIASR